jgi:regulator of protease activity HflC (stomatin/prohibitin superfamily)
MKTRKTEVVTRTKTKDNVTVTIKTALMWGVGPDDPDLEYYYFKLLNPQDQIEAYVDDCIRSHVSSLFQTASVFLHVHTLFVRGLPVLWCSHMALSRVRAWS